MSWMVKNLHWCTHTVTIRLCWESFNLYSHRLVPVSLGDSFTRDLNTVDLGYNRKGILLHLGRFLIFVWTVETSRQISTVNELQVMLEYMNHASCYSGLLAVC